MWPVGECEEAVDVLMDHFFKALVHPSATVNITIQQSHAVTKEHQDISAVCYASRADLCIQHGLDPFC